MKIEVLRYSDNGDSTLGLLTIDSMFECYTLEDEYRDIKIFGETRIPDGLYQIGLRTVGGFNARYQKRFPTFHKGMLEVKDVPNFKYILIHCGNTDEDTAGCLLVGDTINNNNVSKGFIGHSTKAYKRMYKKIYEALANKEKIEIECYTNRNEYF